MAALADVHLEQAGYTQMVPDPYFGRPMSSATAPPSAAQRPRGGQRAEMLINKRIDEVASALWWAKLIRDSLRLAIIVMLAVLAWVVVDQWIYSPGALGRSLFCLALVVWIVYRVVHNVMPLLGHRVQPEYAARSMERDAPEMKQALTSYVSLANSDRAVGLQATVVRTIGTQVAGKLNRQESLPSEATGTFAYWIAAIVTLTVLMAYAVASPKNALQSAARLIAPWASIDPALRVSIQDILPGDASVLAGRDQWISAQIDGLLDGEPASLHWSSTDGNGVVEMATGDKLPKDADAIDTDRFAATLPIRYSAHAPIRYWIRAGDARSRTYEIKPKNVPVVALESVQYLPPSYTGRLPRTSRSGAIEAPDGTRVTIRIRTNRAIEAGKIQFNPKTIGTEVRATAGVNELTIGPDGQSAEVVFLLRCVDPSVGLVQRESYRIQVWDGDGQTNPEPIVYPIEVIEDLPPDVAIVVPQQTPREVPLNMQQRIEVHASDPDYGLTLVELRIDRGLESLRSPTLWEDAKGQLGNQVAEYRFLPAELGLRVGDVVEIRAIATDNRRADILSRLEPQYSVTDP
ncbi:MAG: circumsporozoite protein- membrane associated protein, partial [Planctomycetota bacterium]